MRKIEINYQPSWMVVRVHKTSPTAPSEVTEPVFDVTPLWVNTFKYFDPLRSEQDWIDWRNHNVEDKAERLFDND